MKDNVEFRYLDVKWFDEHTVSAIEPSISPLNVVKIDGEWRLDTITYNHSYPRLGVRILSNEIKHTPYFLSGKDKIDLLEIKEPESNISWWIHSDGWDNRNQWHDTGIFRKVGTIKLCIQGELVTIDNGCISFSVGDLQYSLYSDFKKELWNIILNDTGIVRGSIEKESDRKIGQLDVFLSFAEKLTALLKAPKIELKETQEKKPFRNVRPVNLTFRELSTRGFHKELTSRSHIESIDVPENRYLHYCCRRVLDIINISLMLEQKNIDSLNEKIEDCKKQIKSLEAIKEGGTKIINEAVFDNETKTIERQIKELLDRRFETAIANQPTSTGGNIESEEVKIVFGEQDADKKNQFRAPQINGTKFEESEYYESEYYKEKGYEYVVICMSDEFARIISDFQISSELIIKGFYTWKDKKDNFQKKYLFVNFEHIENIEYIDIREKNLKDRRELRADYEEKGWERDLEPSEIKEIDEEIEGLEKKRKYLSDLLGDGSLKDRLPSIISSLSNCIHYFKKKNVKLVDRFPNTMIFIQNPLYSQVKRDFDSINNSDGMGGEIFDKLLEIDEIGLINIPILYERWCLLKILSILSDVYKYKFTDPSWKEYLIASVANNEKNICFELENSSSNTKIQVFYEKELANRKRPDFVIDINTSDGSKKRMVIDAKFKECLKEAGYLKILKELTDQKNYDENGKNQLFIIMPSASQVVERTSPLDWGGHCDYGQADHHSQGFIFLSPSKEYPRNINNLQRLLGMFIQQNTTVLKEPDRNKEGNFKYTCISCGQTEVFSFKKIRTKTNEWEIRVEQLQSGLHPFTVICQSCGHFCKKTHCCSCGHDLYKNGGMWTYHRTKADQISNVVCPHCQSFLDENWSSRE